MKYPLAEGDDVHYKNFYGSVLIEMSPYTFLKIVPDIQMTTEKILKDEYINGLMEHIKSEIPLDGLEIQDDDHDGRHRAYAAILAGCEKVPVFVKIEMKDFWVNIDKSMCKIQTGIDRIKENATTRTKSSN